MKILKNNLSSKLNIRTELNFPIEGIEFDFINHIDSDTENLAFLIKKEEKLRDILVIVINNLQDVISKSNDKEKVKIIEEKLIDAKEKFELINKDIQILQDSKQKFDNINNLIIELLIKMESENKCDNNYETEILKLKEDINQFSVEFEENKLKVISNENIVNKFLDEEEIRDYFNSIKSELNKSTKELKEQNNKAVIVDSLALDKNSSVLKISEKEKKVYLPYSAKELSEYLNRYPDQYSSLEDVIEKEFILPSDFYLKHPVVARFREAYALIRDRESKTVLDAIKFAVDLMFRYNLNPAIIAACKTQEQLENYLSCLDNNKLDEFSNFEIIFELNPLNVSDKDLKV